MNRKEALRRLGLEDDATAEDIKAAYRETAQILHPDRFAGNKKLQNRATEQFKDLQEAYDALTSGTASSGSAGASRATASSGSRSAAQIEAQLAGIQAARTQLVAERDTLLDSRRNGLIMVGLGAIGAFFLRRLVWVAAIAGTLVVWGIVQVISAQGNINTLNDHLSELKAEKQRLLEQLEDLE